LFLIKPDGVDLDSRQGLFVIGGGRWRPEYESPTELELTDESELYIGIAQYLGAVIAVLAQVPFQPLFDRTEDELIAYTFDRYLETGDAEWPLLLPMVKSAVRGMDAVQAAAAQEWGVDLERFTVLGGSKRGWTTWLTGAVDPRAATLVPVVIDALNFEAHMPHQEAVWGALSSELAPYAQRNLHRVLGSEVGSRLRRIVDPYAYREALTQPKLIVVATNDAYFPVDSLNLYWDELRGPKYVLYLPNDGHSIEDIGRLVPAVDAFHRNGAEGRPLPTLAWRFDEGNPGLSLCVDAAPAPSALVLWSAESEDRDFRNEQFTPQEIDTSGMNALEVRSPSSGYKAVFAEAQFGDEDTGYMLSTNVRVIDSSGRPPSPVAVTEGFGDCPIA
jgi:PhoPQ-activated pathogenicity-related protein